MPLQERGTEVGQRKVLRLYHRIWPLPDGFFNRSGGARTASDFGFAMRAAEAYSSVLRNLLRCRHT